MTLPVTLRVEGQADFDAAFRWYDGQRAGLGANFAMRVQETLDRIAARPEMYPRVLPDVRRAMVRQFPYLVIYQLEPERIVIVAIFHTSRDSSIWQERL